MGRKITRWAAGPGMALALVIGMLSAVRAQDDIERVRAIVQQWLLQQVGKPGLILVEYTYEGTSWSDDALGCPAAGVTYTPGTVHGYRWTFMFDNLVRYEVHSSLDGSRAVLCRSDSTAPEVRLVTYSGPDYRLLVPEAWLAFPAADGASTLFGPQPQPVCDQPGMQVWALGRVAAGVTPDQLLDEHLATAGAADDPAGRIAVGAFGRSTLYQAPCEDTARQWRVTAFVQYGSAYRIEQWAPASGFDAWAQNFLNILSQFASGEALASEPPTATAATSSPTAAAALPELPGLPLAHLFVGDVFLGALNDIPGRSVTTVPTLDRRHLSFSPDGLTLAFIDATNAQLRVLDAAGGLSPRLAAEGVYAAFPFAWSPDGAQIAFVADSGQVAADGAALLEIRTVPAAGGDPQLLGMFPYSGACPAETTDPADAVYFAEAGPGGETPVLAWLPESRMLVSLGCEQGLGVLTLADGQMIRLGADLRGGALAPDRLHFLARSARGLAVLDFVNWQRVNLGVGMDAGQIAWSADGTTAYYATAALAQSFTPDDPALAVRGQGVFGAWPVTFAVYDLALVRVDPSSGQEAVIWQGQGRAVGRIAPAPDGSGLLFSVVSGSLPLANVLQTGADTVSLRETWPAPALYWLSAGETAARLLSYSGQPTFAPVTVPAQP